jgi:hypothetical protein
LEKQFTVFGKSGTDVKPQLAAYYEVNGWVDFLITVAAAPEFIVSGSGMTGLECAKRAKAYDVLSWASVKKDYNVAYNNAYKEK